MNIHVKTFHGLEEILAHELKELGAGNVRTHKRSVNCEGDLELLYRANLMLRTALKILVPIHSFVAQNERELYEQVSGHDWSRYLKIDQTFAIDNTIHSEYFKHSKYAALKTKDAIVDQFRNKYGKRPSIDTSNPDIKFDLHAFKDKFTISIDSSGDPLNKRGYRDKGHPAPLNEVLAAGLVMLSGWKPGQPLIDPMCGTGTILMEAAMLGQNIPPQIKRFDFGFKNWSNFNPTLWNRILADAKANIRNRELQISGADIDSEAVLLANRSARKFQLQKVINVRNVAMENHKPGYPDGMVITNPPYGERIGREDTTALYRRIGDSLKNNFNGFDAWILSSNMEAFKHLRLKPSKKVILFNGPLECKFQKYEMYKGSRG